jgi:hypothetical protein
MGKVKPVIRILAVLTLAGLALGCPEVGTPTPTTGEIAGRALFSGVSDNSGIVITAEVTSRNIEAQVALLRSSESELAAQGVTDSSGAFILSGIPPGTYTVYASSRNSLEKAVVTSVEVVAGERALAGDLSLTPVGDIAGKATLDGAASGNIGIMVYLAGTSWSAMTTDSGSYIISGVPIGTAYQLVAVSLVTAGYQTATAGVDVTTLGSNAAPVLALQPRARVSFDSQGGTAVAGEMSGVDGLVAEPGAPFKDGFHFSGWFKDVEATQPWNFEEDKVTSSITLHAGWLTPPSTLAYTLVNGEYSVAKGAVALSGVVAIPDLVDGKKVTSIAANGFQSCTAVTRILLPSQLTAIGANAFNGCSALTRIDIPDGVTTIGSSAFSTCAKLTAATLPKALTTMGTATFYSCPLLSSISPVPEGVTALPDNAFSGCSSLSRIELPPALLSIGTYAFSGCGSLTSLDIPAGVTSIGMYAFQNCQSLVSLSIPIGVTKLLSYTFSGCSSLVNLYMPGVTTYGNGISDSGYGIFSNCSSLRTLTIPSSVTAIPANLCQNCSSLSSVYFSSITSIGNYAFYGTNLTSISVPTKTTIGSYAFYNCPNLMTVNLNGDIVGDYAFAYCTKLSALSYGYSDNTIGYCAFFNCTALPAQNIVYVSTIGANAYSHCSSMTSVVLSSTVTSIGSNAFGYDGALASVTSQAPTPPTAGTNMFYECPQLTAIHVPNTTAQTAYRAAANWSAYSGIIVTP